MEFDLLKLHQPIDLGAKSWVCGSGKNLRSYILGSVKSSNISFKKLIKDAAEEFNCSEGPFADVFYSGKEWVPLPLINYFVERKILNKKEVLKRIELLKMNTAKPKPVIAVKNLTLTLCKIAGAHAADGNLYVRIGFDSKNKKTLEKILNSKQKQKIYRIKRGEYRYRTDYKDALNILKKKIPKNIKIWQDYALDLTDGYRNAVEAYSRWVKETFGITLIVRKYGSEKNAWRINFSNKIIARYFIHFLTFPIGEKTTIVAEPPVIKNSNQNYRKAFLMGVLLFDGGVAKSQGGIISLVSKSKNLIESANDILKHDGIFPRIYYYKKMDRWHLTFNKAQSKEGIELFERGTEKYQLLRSLHGL